MRLRPGIDRAQRQHGRQLVSCGARLHAARCHSGQPLCSHGLARRPKRRRGRTVSSHKPVHDRCRTGVRHVVIQRWLWQPVSYWQLACAQHGWAQSACVQQWPGILGWHPSCRAGTTLDWHCGQPRCQRQQQWRASHSARAAGTRCGGERGCSAVPACGRWGATDWHVPLIGIAGMSGSTMCTLPNPRALATHLFVQVARQWLLGSQTAQPPATLPLYHVCRWTPA